MPLIYQPRGAAREYSPLALNIYEGCDHACKYCYVAGMRDRGFCAKGPGDVPTPREDFLERLRRELESRRQIRDQVLLSFTGDPYCMADVEHETTRRALLMLHQSSVPVAILTKGGTRCLRDLDLFKRFRNIQVGMTLTFDNRVGSLAWEPGAATPKDRIVALEQLHAAGVRTWASFEPVIDPNQTLRLIELASQVVDAVKIGKLNHDAEADSINWQVFGCSAVFLCRELGVPFYVKRDLRAYLPDGFLTPEESDQDRLNVRNEAI